MRSIIAIALMLALFAAPTFATASTALFPTPTCNPNAGCTMKDGCNGGPCGIK